MRQMICRYIIKISRKLLRRTRIQELEAVKRIYRRVFRFGCATMGNDVTMEYRGLSLVGPVRDFSIVHQLFAGYYEEIEIDIFERLAAASRLIVDVGANIGLYSCAGAAKLPPDGRLVAFEPIPENVEYLRRNLADNGLSDRVSIEVAAAGETDGSVTMYLAKGIGHHSAAAENAIGWTRSISVPVVSLDSYLRDRHGRDPDLMKVDAEGYDGFVLRGARDTLRRARPTLLVEYSAPGLENCGFSPGELLDIIFATYRHVFMVQGLRMRPCDRHALAGLDGRKGQGVSLLALGKDSHLKIVEEWRSANGTPHPATA